MVLTIRNGHVNGTTSPASTDDRGHTWTTVDVRERWPWSGIEPAVEGVLPEAPGREPRGQPAAPVRDPDGGVPWLWQLLSCVASGWEERSGLLRLGAATAAQPVRTRALNALGRFAWQSGDLAAARMFYHEALVIGRATRDGSLTTSLSGLATVAVNGGAYDVARGFEEEALAIRRARRDGDGVARSLATLGWLAAERGDHVEARACFEESLAIRSELGDCPAVAISLLHLGWLAQLRHDRGLASRLLRESLGAVWQAEERWKVVALLGVLGRPPLVGTMVEQALRLLAGAEALDEPTASDTADAGPQSRQFAEARGRLSAPDLATVWADGRDTSIDALVEHVLRAAPATPSRRGGSADGREVLILTAREREVAALVGRGYTNHRIADALVITERTAETHVRNIREKLGFATRAQVAAWAAEHGLLPPTSGG